MQVFEQRMGAPRHIAEVSASVLVDASIRGIDTHGICVLPYYVERWEKGQIVPHAEPELVRETATTLVFDAHQSLGHYASDKAVDGAVNKARTTGIGAAVVRNSTHNGAIGYYAIRVAESEMLGILATACAPRVAPHGGTHGLHGTNPLAYALPRKGGKPVVFDFSTGYSPTKLGKVGKVDWATTRGVPARCRGKTHD